MAPRIALVTGANRGLGLEVVRRLCSCFDGHVYLTARDADKGQEAVAMLKREGVVARFQQLDVTCRDSINRCRDFLLAEHGGLDVLINNAGVFPETSGEDLGPGQRARRSVDTNFWGVNNVCAAFLPHLSTGARVVNVGSRLLYMMTAEGDPELCQTLTSEETSRQDLEQLMEQYVRDAEEGTLLEKGWIDNSYAVSKVGIIALTRILQQEVDKERPEDNILVNCCCPGALSTKMVQIAMAADRITPSAGARIVVELALLPEQAAGPRGRFIKEDGEVLPFTPGLDTYTQIIHDLYGIQPLSMKALIDTFPAVNALLADKLVEWESARRKQ